MKRIILSVVIFACVLSCTKEQLATTSKTLAKGKAISQAATDAGLPWAWIGTLSFSIALAGVKHLQANKEKSKSGESERKAEKEERHKNEIISSFQKAKKATLKSEPTEPTLYGFLSNLIVTMPYETRAEINKTKEKLKI